MVMCGALDPVARVAERAGRIFPGHATAGSEIIHYIKHGKGEGGVGLYVSSDYR
jgi:hypothetical protein